MKKSILIAGALLVFGAASAASAAGINLAWDNCGTNGTQNQTFACNTNAPPGNLVVGSFDPPAGVTAFVGIAAQIDIITDQATLPDWWKHGSGFCRGTGQLLVSLDFQSAAPFGPCIDPYVAPFQGFTYEVGAPTLARARMRIQGAHAAENQHAVDPGTEYYAFKVTFQHTKSTGTGLCTGCESSTCIFLNEIQLFQPIGLGDPKINNPSNQQYVTFQSPPTGPIGCPASTPTQSRTWGQVKSLYR